MPRLVIIDKRPLEFAFVDTDVIIDAKGTYSFAGMSLGTADADRQILVGISFSTTGSPPTGVTVAGVSATRIDGGSAPGTSYNTEVWKASVPSGTTGTVDVSFSVNNIGRIVSAHLYRVAPEITVASSVTVSDVSAPIVLGTTVDVQGSGAVVGVVMASANGTTTWSGIDEDVDVVTAGPAVVSAASKQFVSSQAGLSVSASVSSPTAFGHATFVVLSP